MIDRPAPAMARGLQCGLIDWSLWRRRGVRALERPVGGTSTTRATRSARPIGGMGLSRERGPRRRADGPGDPGADRVGGHLVLGGRPRGESGGRGVAGGHPAGGRVAPGLHGSRDARMGDALCGALMGRTGRVRGPAPACLQLAARHRGTAAAALRRGRRRWSATTRP